MLNASFELGSTPHPDHGNIYEPDHWKVFWRDGGYPPHGDEHEFTQPEVLVITAQPPYLDPLRITHGTQAVKLFTFYAIHDAGLYQRIPVPKGSKVTFSCKAHAWSSTDDDPHTSDQDGDAYDNFNFKVGIDPYGDIDPWEQSVVWQLGKHIYDIYSQVPSLTVTAQEDYVTLFIRSTVKYPFKHCDAYIDNCELVIGLPEPEPPTNTIPAGGYDKEYWVVRSEIPAERRQAIGHLAMAEQKTVGPSADDARAWATELCDLGRTVKAVPWDIPQDQQAAWVDYFHTREPRIIVEFRGNTPEPPPPPPPNGPDPIVHYSGNFVGLQHYENKQGWIDYIIQAKPTVVKHFQISSIAQAKIAAPEILTVWRLFVNQGDTGVMMDAGRAGALALLDRYSRELDIYFTYGMLSEIDLFKKLVLESLNETYASFNAPQINKAVRFDAYFSELLHARYGNVIKAGLANVQVGNPHESEVELLLPLAKLSHETGDFLAYHGYWSANRERNWLIENYPYHSGRWTEWDKVFNQHGYYPRYFLGECGICYAPDGWGFLSKQGWKSCGSFEKYIEQLIDFNELIDMWNAGNQGRCFGGTVFIYGHDGWPDFDFEPGDLLELQDAMRGYA